MDKGMRYAGISGIGVVFLYAVNVLLGVLEFFGTGSEDFLALSIVISIIYLIFAIPFIYGFILLGEKTKNKLLVYSSYMTLVLLIPGTLLIAFFTVYPGQELLGGIFSLLFIFIAGIVGIAFGAGILKLKKQFRELATAAGILEILCGLLYLTVIFYLLGAFLGIITIILEVALLLKASKKF